jgi:nucleoside-diphosphate-sugar epimerase
LTDPRMIDHREEVRPDSLNGTSKGFGEALGRYYAEQYEMSVVCLRIGSVLPDDDPVPPAYPPRYSLTKASKIRALSPLRSAAIRCS